uniref:Pre-pro-legumin n=1 Tax=Sagittaria sagittifolia TaxID=4451 RepID=P93559_SAGSA|nr:pre-pro-legumin [Sagittaria sagittifolia]
MTSKNAGRVAGFFCCLVALLLFPSTYAITGSSSQLGRKHGMQGRQQRDECSRLDRLNQLQPSWQLQSEAGFSEVWDHNENELQCAGVSVTRHTIHQQGLLLPSHSNSQRVVYVVEGEGIGGVVIPGCSETFTSSEQEQGPYSSSPRGQSGQFPGGLQQAFSSQGDQHQRVQQLRKGDVLTIPAGFATWAYNNGDRPLILIVFLDFGDSANQLDSTPRRFFLSGGQQQQGQSQTQIRGGQSGRGQGQQQQQHGYRGSSSVSEQFPEGNLFDGFDVDIIAQSFGVNYETAQKLKSSSQQHQGFIIRVERDLQVARPTQREAQEWFQSQTEQGAGQIRRAGSRFQPFQQGGGRPSSPFQQGGTGGVSPYQQGGRGSPPYQMGGQSGRGSYGPLSNGIEESICNLKFKVNIGNPIHADVYSREGGHLTTLNSFKLPILSYLQLTVEKGHLRQNALVSPHWNGNAHSVMYAIRGNARVQIVDNSGRAVFDDMVNEGQVVVVPQNYAVVKQAVNDEFEWISLKTNDNAMVNQITGKNSVLNGIPEDVLVNAYQLSRDEVKELKQNRHQESLVLTPHQSQWSGRAAQ